MKRNNNFVIGLLNIGSLNTGWDEFIEIFKTYNLDILCLNETWLSIGSDTRAYTIPGYRLIHSPRGSRGGGVGAYIRSDARVKRLSHPAGILEQLWLQVRIHNYTALIGIAYKPPSMCVGRAIDSLCESLSVFAPQYDNLFLMGDLNINCLDSDKKLYQPHCLKCVFEPFKLKQVVSVPTRITDSTERLIDLCFVNLQTKISSVSVTHNDDLSDHALIMVRLPIRFPKPKPRTITYRPLLDNADAIINAARYTPWELVEQLDDVNKMVKLFTDLLVDLFDTFAPVRTRTFKSPPTPWMTDTLRAMRSLRDRACQKAKSSRKDSAIEYYRELRNLVNSATKKEKSAYFAQYVNENQHCPTTMWRHINRLVNPQKNDCLPDNLADPHLLNDHFVNSVPQSTKISNLSSVLDGKFHSDAKFEFENISPIDVHRIIKSFKSNSSGSDKITIEMLKLTLPHSLDAITAIVNKSINTNTFPTEYKCALVTPIPKKPNPENYNDLRPISILPTLSKIIEKAVLKQMFPFLESNCVLPKLQSGFRKHHSTTTALMNITDDVITASEKGLSTILVLLDFSRAFDCVDVALLISKLKYYGFSPDACKWFESYFDKRSQIVQCQNSDGLVRSKQIPVTRGVIQGSILGPTLFAIYTASITENIQHTTCHLYADDTQDYIHVPPTESGVSEGVELLNKDLSSISNWSLDHRLVLNPSKSVAMILGTSDQVKKVKVFNPNLIIDGSPIPICDSIRNLGLIMDENLRYEKHVRMKSGMSFSALKTLYKLRPYLCERVRFQLCGSLVLSHLQYCDIVYGPRLFKKTQKQVQKVQNACIRYTFPIYKREHISPHLALKGILNMTNQRNLKLSSFMYNLTRSQVPRYLYEKLIWTSQTHNRTRSSAYRLTLPIIKKEGSKGGFKFAASKIWNDLPPPSRTAESLQSFKNSIYTFLIKQQKALLNISS